MNDSVISSFEGLSVALGISGVLFWALLVALALWLIIIKGFALWHAARNHQPYWFVALLVLNTIGLLEVVYLVWFRTDKRKGATPSLFNNPEGSDSSPSA